MESENKNQQDENLEKKPTANEGEQPVEHKDEKKKKHHGHFEPRSAVDHVRRHSYNDTNFGHTGTNLSYREEDE